MRTGASSGSASSGSASSDGLVIFAESRWPAPGDAAPPRIPGFVVSSFSPMVAAVAERCLRSRYGAPPADPARGARTAIVIVSAHGDIATAATITADVDADRRVVPLLFFQSVPNSAAGHVAARWGLCGPVVCVSPAGDAADEGRAVAGLLIADGDADEVLIILAEQAAQPGHRDQATALLLGHQFVRPDHAAY
jgi:3-oxoacyl-(acyl-carrier-protein) synthase